jgi:hypothetical protein
VDGAVVVDVKNMQQFSMNTTSWHATIGGGTLLADVTTRLHDAGGRAMAHGVCPQVGIGGHATIGGLGPASRMWGAALDHVEEVEIVLADSSIVRASATQNADVFWAVKGAGASFGVITEFVVHTEPEPGDMVSYAYHFTFGSHTEMAQTFKDWQAVVAQPNLTRQLASELILLELGMIISGTFFGSKAEYDALNLATIFSHSTSAEVNVVTDWLGLVEHWAENEALQLVGGIPSAFYSKSLAVTPTSLIPNDTADALFSFLDTADKGTLVWFAIFDLSGGAIADIPANATAYAHRDALYYLQTYAIDLGRVTNTTRAFLNGLNDVITGSMPGVTFGAYPGYVDPALPNGQLDYWGTNLPRLEQIKAAVDPRDLFRNPQSVRPAQA